MLKLLSLNIEGDNHLESVVQLVHDEQPDVVCFNEVFESDVAFLKHSFNMDGEFFPAETIIEPNDYRLAPRGNMGTLVMSGTGILSSRVDCYDGDLGTIPELTNANGNAANRFLVWVEVEKDGQIFNIVTTHFTVTRGGEPSELQRRNMKKILSFLEAKPDFVFCGDFNAPRGGEIFSMLSSKYRDNIPKEVVTSLDRNLHRNGEDEGFPELVVDGLFSAGSHQVHDARVVCGVSDHCAVISLLSLESK